MGTGDGSYVYKSARDCPDKLFIGIDSNADNLCEYSLKASRKLQKGGLPNVVYVQAAVESLPEELVGLASELTILLPWGSLLKAVAMPDVNLLKGIAQLCKNKATFKVLFGYDLANEQKIIDQLSLPLLDPNYLNTELKCAYLQAGFTIEWKIVSQEELKNLSTTWAKKLAYGKKRQFIQIEGVLLR